MLVPGRTWPRATPFMKSSSPSQRRLTTVSRCIQAVSLPPKLSNPIPRNTFNRVSRVGGSEPSRGASWRFIAKEVRRPTSRVNARLSRLHHGADLPRHEFVIAVILLFAQGRRARGGGENGAEDALAGLLDGLRAG